MLQPFLLNGGLNPHPVSILLAKLACAVVIILLQFQSGSTGSLGGRHLMC